MVNYKFDPKTTGIVLFTTFKGKEFKTGKMILDTGATYTTIPWNIAEALGYKPAITKKLANITTVEGSMDVPVITLKSVNVLGKKAENVDVIVHDLPETSRVDGLLGLSYLRNFKLTLDFKNGLLSLE